MATRMKIIIALIAALSLVGFAQAAEAKKKSPKALEEDKILSDVTYACLSNVASGLIWEDGQWQARSFQPYGKFLLTITEFQVKGQKIIHFKIKGDDVERDCINNEDSDPMKDVMGVKKCIALLGISVYFVPRTGRGGISYLLGSVIKDGQVGGFSLVTGDERDPLVVMPFTCEKF